MRMKVTYTELYIRLKLVQKPVYFRTIPFSQDPNPKQNTTNLWSMGASKRSLRLLLLEWLHIWCHFFQCSFECIIDSIGLIIRIRHDWRSTRSGRSIGCLYSNLLWNCSFSICKKINENDKKKILKNFFLKFLLRKNIFSDKTLPRSLDWPLAKGLMCPFACMIPVNLSLMLIFCGFRITILNCWVDGFGWTSGPGPVILEKKPFKNLRLELLIWGCVEHVLISLKIIPFWGGAHLEGMMKNRVRVYTVYSCVLLNLREKFRKFTLN